MIYLFAILLAILSPASTAWCDSGTYLDIKFNSFPAEPLLGNKLISLEKLKGKIVIIDFWASWCEPCKNSFPFYNELFLKYKDQGLVIIGVSTDDNTQERDRFLKDHPVEFLIYYDKSKQMISDFKVKILPSLFLFDKELKPVRFFGGFNSKNKSDLEAEIKKLLNK